MPTRLLLSLLILTAALPAQQYVTSTGLTTAGEGRSLQLERRWDPLFEDGFEQGLGRWQVRNFENRLQVTAGANGAHGAGQGLLVIGDATGDTAWELTSQPVPVPAGREFELRFWTRHEQDLQAASGHQASYWNRLDWRDAAGQELGFTAFDLGEGGAAWREVTVAAQVPDNAAQVVLRFGFDQPNLAAGLSFRLDDVRLQVRAEPAAYVASGQLVSRPRHLPGAAKLAWQAAVPANTSLWFAVRSAPDRDGAPGQWSTWVPCSGDLAPAAPDALWWQYLVNFKTDAAGSTPVLREVTLASPTARVVDDRWTGPDVTPPALVKVTPGRRADPLAPFTFRLVDGEGVGIDPRSVTLSVDGQAVTAELTRGADGGYTWQPRQPLAPVPLGGGWAGWLRGNYNGALTFRSEPPRVAGRPPAISVGRDLPRVDTAFRIASPPIPVAPGAAYELSVYARHDFDLTGAGAKPGSHASGLRFTDAAGQPVGEFLPLSWGKANDAWHRVALSATAPAGAAFAVVSFGWDAPDLSGGQRLYLADPDLAGPHPAQPNQPNFHRLSVTAADLAGNTATYPWYALIKEPPATGLATMRDDGVVLVDGRPFFPIGMYSVWKRPHNRHDFDVAFSELRDAGMTVAHTYHSERTPDFPEFYGKAHEYGFKLFLAARGGSNVADPESVLADVVRECNEPALLSWYLADDTASHISAAELRRVHEAVHDVDPYHLTCQADGVGQPTASRYARYVDSTDVFLPELYPVRLKEAPDQVADLVRDLRTVQADFAAAGSKRPVWAIVQAFFGWGWQRYPTDAEVRAMTWLSVIHGATGMTYYTYGGHDEHKGAEDDPGVWANLKKVTSELASLRDVLVERTPPQTFRIEITGGATTDRLGQPAVTALLKTHGGRHYLFAASSTEQPSQVRIRVEGLTGPVETLFENRTASVQDGVLVDAFAGYAVHIYRW